MKTKENQYIENFSSKETEALRWLVRQTNIRTNYPRMLSGQVQGQLLTMLVRLTRAKNILEIGAFTGYSSICLAYGLENDGHIDSLEINDELADLIYEAQERAGVKDKISVHFGDALDNINKLDTCYDLVFIDANKREYIDYYKAVFDKVRKGGLIIADDVLWSGKVYADKIDQDKQTQGIMQFNEMIANDPRVDVVILPLRDGISLIRKK